MNPSAIFQNILRTMLFGFICGVIFTILFMIATYTIVDASMKSAIFEERFMNYLESNPNVGLLNITRMQFVEIITQATDLEQKNDKMGLRIRILDPITRELLVPTPNTYPLVYDPSGIRENYFAATSSDPTEIKSNYAGVQTYRLYWDTVTEKNYLLQFQYISG